MTNVKGIDPTSVTPAPSSTSSSATPAVLATLPQHRLTAVMPEALRAIDWCGHVPTAPHGPVTMTRAEVQEQLAASDGDDNERWLPTLPGPRRSPEAPTPKVPRPRGAAYDEQVLGFGGIHAHSAFGSAA